jgi:hypothetical protein
MAAKEEIESRDEYDRETASLIAGQYENYQCVECARDIVRSLGPKADAVVIKVHVSRGFPQVLGAPIGPGQEIVNIATTGHHVGVEVAGLVFDNHYSDGRPLEEWSSSIVSDGPLQRNVHPIGDFFDTAGNLLDAELSGFLSNRFQT